MLNRFINNGLEFITIEPPDKRFSLPPQTKALSAYYIKSEGQPCNPGETSTHTGCIPASGETKHPTHKPEEIAAQRQPVQVPSIPSAPHTAPDLEPPFKPTMDDETIKMHTLAENFRRGEFWDDDYKTELTIGDMLRQLELRMQGVKAEIPITEYYMDIRRKLKEEKIDIDKLSDAELMKLLADKGYLNKGDVDRKLESRLRASRMVERATAEERKVLLPYLAQLLAKYDTTEHSRHYLDLRGSDRLTAEENRLWADSLEEVAQGKPLTLKLDESEGKQDIDYKSGLSVARVQAWRFTKNYDAFVSGFASSWAMTGGGVDAQQVMNTVSKNIPQNTGKSFWTRERSNYKPAQFDEQRMSEHFKTLKHKTEEFYKQKLGKKNAANFDLSTRTLEIMRGVGGNVEAYMPSPVESWTTDKPTVKRFGKLMAEGGSIRFHSRRSSGLKVGTYSLLKAKITYNDILFSYETMKDVPGWPAEKNLKGKKEFVPFGGALTDIQSEVVYE